MDNLVILYTTWPDAETAAAFGRLAVERKLAACANVLSPMRSIYAWDGAVRDEAETPMLLKTTEGVAQRLRDLVLERHPYAVPCVIALPVAGDYRNPAYAEWVSNQVG